ncbi:EsaB/YukD family protein, partial [Pseudonocardia hydrocarbonoxydans]|uniref:EsaB/YukD family protein n=1 Tax=Pseudonocardia hydrocarbonoxydans TaxID=76726 RepID=UPI0031D38232
MPSVRPPVADPAPPAYTRLTVLAPRTRVDVALPADLPLGELVPMVLELVGEPGPGHAPLPWRLSGVTGGPLHPAATLDELGVLDGEMLRIGPATAPPPSPVFDDPVDALASAAGRTAGPRVTPRAGVAVVLGGLAAAVLAPVPPGPWAVT